MLIRFADGRTVALDYRETAPASATRDMYVGPDGNVMSGPASSTVGWRASGVPGSVAGFALALQKYGSGKVTWSDVCEPARRLAADGHRVSPIAAALHRTHAPRLAHRRASTAATPAAALLGSDDGGAWLAACW